MPTDYDARYATTNLQNAALRLAEIIAEDTGEDRLTDGQKQGLYSAGLALSNFVHYLSVYDRKSPEACSVRGVVLASLARVHRALCHAAELDSY